MPHLDNILNALDRVNWDFPGSGTGGRGVHALHAFPGNSIPQIPSSLIQILSQPDDVVFDPFGGSGTTAIEAMRLGRNAISSDLLSASVLAMRGKIAAFTIQNIADSVDELLQSFAWDHLCESDSAGKNNEGGNAALLGWYHPRTLRQLKYIWNFIELQSESMKFVLELLFSDVLFYCASTRRSKTATGLIRRHHWGWIADNVLPENPIDNNAIDNFRRRLIQLREITRSNLPQKSCHILRQDARALALKSESVDLIVSSPPYVGVIDYARANRLVYLWNNWDLDRERNQETGARFKRGRKSLQADYLSEMDLCWKEIARVLKPNGYCAIVIGESRKYPGTVDETLGMLSKYLTPVWGAKQRVPSRRRVSDRSAQEAVEHLMVWTRK